MGCATSKVDNPAVALCRDRCSFLDEAIRQRFILAEAHLAYLHSLKSVGLSLDRFFTPDDHSQSDGDLDHDHGHSDSSFNSLHHDHKEKDVEFMKFNYMKKHPTKSVVHTQRPATTETSMHMASSSYNSYPNYSTGRGGFSDGFEVEKEPPPPPSPPRYSGWDFLDPFESYAYTPSRDSAEVREEEGIPELEDDYEVVKEVHVDDQKVKDARVSIKEVHMVDKNVVIGTDDKKLKNQFKPHAAGVKSDAEVVKEIQLQFERAFECGTQLSKFLEVGKVPYKRKHVSFKHLKLKSSYKANSAFIDADQDAELRSKTLSSTLHKLYLWEKKLYQEVKVEEKMRHLHERKSKNLNQLNDKGSEATKVDVNRTLVRNLYTKIKIAIQVVDKISVKINGLRDDELWPQLNEFIHGSTRMWKSMLECHQNQCRAIGEAKRLDTIASRKEFSDAHFEATRQLEHDLINWALKFSSWVDAQKNYVQALTNWLMKCLLYVPEETSDGIAPFSPSGIGAPAVFVVCNQWCQSLDRISDNEVIDSMKDFASNVLQLWEKDKNEIRQRMLANKETMKIKSLDKEDLEIQKKILMLNFVAANVKRKSTGHVVYQSETTKTRGSLQSSLRHVLEAMEGFTSSTCKVYEDLLQRIEEDHLSREHG